jgi:Copper binding proteins, plastocyanin/azurin family
MSQHEWFPFSDWFRRECGLCAGRFLIHLSPVEVMFAIVAFGYLFGLVPFGFRLIAKAGEITRKSVVFDKVGEYEYACDLPGHHEAGMKSTLIVTPSDFCAAATLLQYASGLNRSQYSRIALCSYWHSASLTMSPKPRDEAADHRNAKGSHPEQRQLQQRIGRLACMLPIGGEQD